MKNYIITNAGYVLTKDKYLELQEKGYLPDCFVMKDETDNFYDLVDRISIYDYKNNNFKTYNRRKEDLNKLIPELKQLAKKSNKDFYIVASKGDYDNMNSEFAYMNKDGEWVILDRKLGKMRYESNPFVNSSFAFN